MCCLDYNKYVAKWSCNISCWQELLQVKKTIKVLQRATLYYNIFGYKILFWSKRLHFEAKIDNFLTYMLFNVLVLQKINFCMYTNSLVNGDSFYANFTSTTFQKIPIPHLTRTKGSRLMRILLLRISLMRFFKTFQKYLAYAFLGIFISLLRFYTWLMRF